MPFIPALLSYQTQRNMVEKGKLLFNLTWDHRYKSASKIVANQIPEYVIIIYQNQVGLSSKI